MGKYTEKLMREDLPYGQRTMADGTVELFNRKYETIRWHGPGESREVVEQEFFYSDANPPWRSEKTRQRCANVMREWAEQ